LQAAVLPAWQALYSGAVAACAGTNRTVIAAADSKRFHAFLFSGSPRPERMETLQFSPLQDKGLLIIIYLYV
jgi:hypothetical protein